MFVPEQHGITIKIGINRMLKSLTILCLACAIAACVTPTPNVKNPEDWKQALSSGNASVVFGRIQWLEHGTERKIGKGLFDFSIAPILLRLEDRSKISGEVDEDGFFAWPLQPGIYVINRINYRDPWSGNYFITPKVAFRVPDRGKLYYVGTLKVDFESKRDLIGGLSGRVNITIKDQDQHNYSSVANHFGMSQMKTEKSVMIHDERLPGTIDTTAEFNMALQIINSILFGVSH